MKTECIIHPRFPLGMNLSLATKSYYGAFTRYMEENHELEKHFSVLLLLDASDKQYTQQCICDRMLTDKVSMVRILDHLDEKGYIRRVTNPEDRRERWVQLTPKARKELPRIRVSVENMNQKAFKGFTEAEVESLYEMLKRVYANTRELPSHPVTVNYKKSTARK